MPVSDSFLPVTALYMPCNKSQRSILHKNKKKSSLHFALPKTALPFLSFSRRSELRQETLTTANLFHTVTVTTVFSLILEMYPTVYKVYTCSKVIRTTPSGVQGLARIPLAWIEGK